ncbi:MAG: Gfo/Idh/MocA family oxidoreductase [Firmicutes bacterium]|nr:Gfo/Idh/MocA family oxidoreductase [Bacillota bacterium]
MKDIYIQKLGFGVISASVMVREHMKSIKMNINTELRAVCDIDAEKAKQAAADFEIESYYVDYRQMLERPDIDVVIVATPDQLHAEQTVKSLEAGKHVLCEKPMALTLGECRVMIEASERSGKKLMIGQICRYAPAFKLAKKLIDEGQIGELFYVESEYAHDYTEIPGVGNWRKDPVKLRHPFLGGGCHAVDLLRWIAGDPLEVTAYANRKVLKDWPVDDCTVAIMRFPLDVIGKVFVSIGCKRNYTMRSAFYGDKGTIIADNTSPYITIYKKSISKEGRVFHDIREQEIGLIYPVPISTHNTFGEIEEFADIILNGKSVLTDGKQGAATVAVCLAVVESVEKGSKVKVDYKF